MTVKSKILFLLQEQSLCYSFTCFFFGPNEGKVLHRSRSFLLKKTNEGEKGNPKGNAALSSFRMKKQTNTSKRHSNFYKSLENESRSIFRAQSNIHDEAKI